MAIEIERKFLVNGEKWRSLASGIPYRQGYICTQKEAVVRVRIVGDRGYLTIKGLSRGNSRAEFEYPIPLSDAQTMLQTMCEPPLIEKTRYLIKHRELIWEVDEFWGENAGLIIAEVELTSENQVIDLPEWVGREVSHDPRYFNSNLIKYPFSQWTD
jgi:CYTH domain-containing protein